MNVTVEDILAKISTLPADYESHVHLGEIVAGAMLAEVDSFTDHLAKRAYTVKIEGSEKAGELIAVCPCRSPMLCSHVTAFYAVAKKDDLAVMAALAKREAPPAKDALPLVSQADPRKEALRLIAKAEEGYEQAHADLLAALALMRKGA